MSRLNVVCIVLTTWEKRSRDGIGILLGTQKLWYSNPLQNVEVVVLKSSLQSVVVTVLESSCERGRDAIECCDVTERFNHCHDGIENLRKYSRDVIGILFRTWDLLMK